MDDTSVRREHLVETALRLFSERGFHATGIDTILAEAGVAKMTLYKYFKGKDDLIRAALELRDRRWKESLREELQRRGKTPQQRLLAVFDVLGDWFAQDEFRGCLFINAAAEYCGLDERIGDLTARHKRLMRQEIAQIAREGGLRRPDALADQLSLLVEGATVMALIERSPAWADRAKEAARIL